MRLGPHTQFELPRLLRLGHVDSGISQPANVVVAAPGIDDGDGLFAVFEAVLDERQQRSVLVVAAMEERTDVTMGAENRASRAEGREGGGISSPEPSKRGAPLPEFQGWARPARRLPR